MSNIIGFQRNREATQRLHELGYTSLIVYKEAWGWKVWDTNLSGCQHWNGLKRQASGCVSAVKRGLLPQEAPHILSSTNVSN